MGSVGLTPRRQKLSWIVPEQTWGEKVLRRLRVEKFLPKHSGSWVAQRPTACGTENEESQRVKFGTPVFRSVRVEEQDQILLHASALSTYALSTLSVA